MKDRKLFLGILAGVISIMVITTGLWVYFQNLGQKINSLPKPTQTPLPSKLEPSLPGNGFCGSSTYGDCFVDSDCTQGGCSGEVCQSKSEEPVITTCEWKDCYDSRYYGVLCKCINKQCQWHKQED